MAETAISRGRKYTTLEDLEQHDKGPVWVLNNTRDSLEGKVVISVPKRNGNGYDIIRVPRSFAPFDLTQQAPRAQLIDSADFRKALNTRLIRLVTAEYAAVLLNTEEAKEEITRLRNEENKAKMALKKAGVVEDTTSGVGDDDDDEFFEVAGEGKRAAEAKKKKKASATKADEPEAEAKVKSGPSMKVQAIVAGASRDELSETAIVAKLKNVAKLRRADLAFLARTYSDKPRIIRYLKAVKKEMEA